MRLFGFVLLIAGFLLCVSIVWAALGFLMMGFGLICLLIAERNRKRAPRSDVPDLVARLPIAAAPKPDKAVARQQPAVFLEPTFAAASSGASLGAQAGVSDSEPEEDWSLPVETAVAPLRVENVGDRRAPPPPRATRSSEFDRIRALRAERAPVRNEPEFRDFSAPLEQEPRQPPPPLPLPAQSVSAVAAVPPPITVLPPIVAESKAVAKEPLSETTPTKPAAVQAERTVLFDDADDLADLFNKFDLGKD
ncbi:MAG: hypothetical protein ABI192_15810 [Bradyrhizobium sp.]